MHACLLKSCWSTVNKSDGAHRYNAQYAARLEGWEAARVRDLAAHTEKARHAFSSAGGHALARELVEKACPWRMRLLIPRECSLHDCRVCSLPANVLVF